MPISPEENIEEAFKKSSEQEKPEDQEQKEDWEHDCRFLVKEIQDLLQLVEQRMNEVKDEGTEIKEKREIQSLLNNARNELTTAVKYIYGKKDQKGFALPELKKEKPDE